MPDQSDATASPDDLKISYISGGGPLREAAAIEGRLQAGGLPADTKLMFTQSYPEGPWVTTLPADLATQVVTATDAGSRSVELVLTDADASTASEVDLARLPKVSLPLVVNPASSATALTVLAPQVEGVAWLPGMVVFAVAGLGCSRFFRCPRCPPCRPSW